jgi:hypothetical protein
MPIPTGISGSRAAAILGLSKYATPFSVWQDLMEQRHGEGWNAKQGYAYEPFEGNTATEFGHAFEDSIINLTEKKLDHVILDREAVFTDGGFTTCHIDGIINRDKLFEGKHCNFRVFGLDWGEPGTDRVPTAIQCQVQHNLMLTGLESAVVSVLVIPKTVQDFEAEGWQAHYDTLNGVHFLKNHETDQIIDPLTWAKTFAEIGNFHVYKIEARPDTQKLLKEMYSDFWSRYIIGDEVPDAVDYDDIKSQFTAPKGELVVTDSIKEMISEYSGIGKEIGASGHLKKRQNFLKTQILKYAKDETTIIDDDSQERIIFLDNSGKRLGTFNGATFRARK